MTRLDRADTEIEVRDRASESTSEQLQAAIERFDG
jgi:hypothetical protein